MLNKWHLASAVLVAAGALAAAPRTEAAPVGVRIGYGGVGYDGIGYRGVGVSVGGYGYYRPGFYAGVTPYYPFRPSFYSYSLGWPWYYGTFYSNPNYYSNFYAGPTYVPSNYPAYPYTPSYAYSPRSPLAGTSVGSYRSLYPPTAQGYVPGNYTQQNYVAPTYVPPTPAASAPAQSPNTALLDVRVPQPNAQVLIDGTRTTRQGAERQFVSPPLEPGKRYSYEIEARWMEDGKEVSQTRKVVVEAGRRIDVDFTRPAQP